MNKILIAKHSNTFFALRQCLHTLHIVTFQSFAELTYSLYKSIKQSVAALSFTQTKGHPYRYNKNNARQVHNGKHRMVVPAATTPLRTVPDHIPKPPYVESGVVGEEGSTVEIKNEEQIRGMRSACQLARKILNHVALQLEVILAFFMLL